MSYRHLVFPQVLAMCFVRKALEWLFTRHDLKWLDDIMPEAHKREKEKKKKKHDDTEPSHKKHHVGKTWSGHDVVGATVPSESAVFLYFCSSVCSRQGQLWQRPLVGIVHTPVPKFKICL